MFSLGEQLGIKEEGKGDGFHSSHRVSDSEGDIIGAVGEGEISQVMFSGRQLEGLNQPPVDQDFHLGIAFQEKGGAAEWFRHAIGLKRKIFSDGQTPQRHETLEGRYWIGEVADGIAEHPVRVIVDEPDIAAMPRLSGIGIVKAFGFCHPVIEVHRASQVQSRSL